MHNSNLHPRPSFNLQQSRPLILVGLVQHPTSSFFTYVSPFPHFCFRVLCLSTLL